MAEKFIAKATAHAHGQFKAKAEAAGMTTRDFAEKHQHDSGLLGQQARLALTLMGMHHKGAAKQEHEGEKKHLARKAAGQKESPAHKLYPAHN